MTRKAMMVGWCVLAAAAGCAATAATDKVATGLARLGGDIGSARQEIALAMPGVGAVPAGHLASADRDLVDGSRTLDAAVKADAAREGEYDKLAADDKAVRNTIGYRVEVFIVRAFWAIVIVSVLAWVAAIVLYVAFGGATSWVGTLARQLHATLPLMTPANWIAALIQRPNAAVPAVAAAIASH